MAGNRNADGKRSQKNGGGYDCAFVTRPPNTIQTQCPVCLRIPKEPCLASCLCGKEFCRECAEEIQGENKPCPLCNKPGIIFLRHHGSERYLKAQEVWCSQKKNGCDWRGKLGEYEQHLNLNPPSPENQLIGCQFVEVECERGCGERFLRRHITSHQNLECRKRPYSCEYCHDYHSNFQDVTGLHYSQCTQYPVPCPNRCQETAMKRQELQKHIEEECPLTEVNCPLHFAGCGVRLPRKDMPEHLKDTVTHLTLLATTTQSLLKENQELKRHNQQLELKQESMEKQFTALQEEMQTMKLCLGGLPIIFAVNYENNENVVYLPSFYTHAQGYRMCIQFYPNGFQSAKSTHVSLFMCLMRGGYDDYLKWPFRGEITIQIVNQAGDHSHVERVIPYNDETPDDTAGRMTDKERAKGWGFLKYLVISDLDNNIAKNTQYLKNGTLMVRVVGVKITT